MYKNYFGLKKNPFSISPDPHFLFMSEGHREALAHLRYGLESDNGFVLLTGEVGSGKTTICRCLLKKIPAVLKVACITNTMLSLRDFLATVCDEFGIKYPANTKNLKFYADRIKKFLIFANQKGLKPVLIIDEAQNLSKNVLELIRLLTNLETNKRKLLMVVMLGQPEFRKKLDAPEFLQLRQRITARYHLEPLSKKEVVTYVRYRLAVAGKRQKLFCNSTFSKLYKLSEGVPRVINSICDRALLGAYTQGLTRVDKKTMTQAGKEYFGHKPNISQFSSYARPLVLCSLLMTIGLGSLFAEELHFIIEKAVKLPQTLSMALRAPEPIKQINIGSVEQSVQLQENIESAKVDPSEKKTLVVDEPKPEPQVSIESAEVETGGTHSMPVDVESLPYTDSYPEQIDSDTLAWPDHQPIENSKTLAFKSLFEQWGELYNNYEDGLACQHAKNIGLGCFFFQGNLGTLRKLNRPAVLKMVDENGIEFYTTLLGLKEGEADVDFAGEYRKISNSELERYWVGVGILLWQPPPDYELAATPGTSAPWLGWLADKLEELGWISAIYDVTYLSGDLLEYSRLLQSESGFEPDGVVGPRTLICLNTLLGANVPTLSY